MLLEYFVVLLSLFVLVALRIYYRKFMPLLKKTRDWPSAPSLPLIGHAQYFLHLPPERIFDQMRNLSLKYGKDHRLKCWFGTELNLFTGNATDMAALANSADFNPKSDQYGIASNWLREGLLLSSGEKWFKRRKLLTPAFHFTILKQFEETFVRQSNILLDNLSCYASIGQQVELLPILSRCTLDAICESSMGVSVNAQTNSDSDYVRAVNTMRLVTKKRISNIFYHFNLTYKWTGTARAEKQALSVLHGFTERIIRERRQELLTNVVKCAGQDGKATLDENNNESIGIKRKWNFIDILLQSTIDGQSLSDLDIREEVDTFIFEGFETTATALNFFFYSMATNPHCQQRVYEEVISVFGTDKSSVITFEGLNKLHYVEMCVKETLRMFPPVPAFGRKALQDTELNGLTIPCGANINIFPMYMGYVEEHFPDPYSFKPERFDCKASNANKVNPYAFLAFSAGARNCIGQKYAMLELKTIIANVIRNYEIFFVGDPHADLGLMFGMTLCTKDPLLFQIRPRQNKCEF